MHRINIKPRSVRTALRILHRVGGAHCITYSPSYAITCSTIYLPVTHTSIHSMTCLGMVLVWWGRDGGMLLLPPTSKSSNTVVDVLI